MTASTDPNVRIVIEHGNQIRFFQEGFNVWATVAAVNRGRRKVGHDRLRWMSSGSGFRGRIFGLPEWNGRKGTGNGRIG